MADDDQAARMLAAVYAPTIEEADRIMGGRLLGQGAPETAQHPLDVLRGESPQRGAPEAAKAAASTLPPAYLTEREYYRRHFPENNPSPQTTPQPPAQRELPLRAAR